MSLVSWISKLCSLLFQFVAYGIISERRKRRRKTRNSRTRIEFPSRKTPTIFDFFNNHLAHSIRSNDWTYIRRVHAKLIKSCFMDFEIAFTSFPQKNEFVAYEMISERRREERSETPNRVSFSKNSYKDL